MSIGRAYRLWQAATKISDGQQGSKPPHREIDDVYFEWRHRFGALDPSRSMTYTALVLSAGMADERGGSCFWKTSATCSKSAASIAWRCACGQLPDQSRQHGWFTGWSPEAVRRVA